MKKNDFIALLFALLLTACTSTQTPPQTPTNITTQSTLTHADPIKPNTTQNNTKNLVDIKESIQQTANTLANTLNNIDPYDLNIINTTLENFINTHCTNLCEYKTNTPLKNLLEHFKQNIKTENHEEYLKIFINTLINTQNFKQARHIARNEIAKSPMNASTYISLFYNAFDKDPEYDPQNIRTIENKPNNIIKALGGGSTLTFKYQENNVNIAAIKPDQDLRQSMYRSEIAFYRLAERLGASFRVPFNYEMKISKNNFNALYNKVNSSKQNGYRSKFVHLLWKKESNTEFLYATFKQWVPSFAPFPIEVLEAWQPHLRIPAKPLPTKQRFFQNFTANARPDSPISSSKYLNYTENIESTDILRQISDLILIDFLTNNWDRFSGDPANYGANCHIENGGIVAIDNGAAFPPWHTPRVVRRLHYIQIFNKNLYHNLLSINDAELFQRLFPNPTKEEIKAFSLFKERKTQAIDYIQMLIKKYGEDKVLAL